MIPPIRLKLEQYRGFLGACWHFVGLDRKLFIALVAVSICGALTEGLGISLFVPLIDTISSRSSFSNVPLLASVSEAFAAIAPESRIQLVAAIMFLVVLVRGGLQYVIQLLNSFLPASVEQRLRHAAFDCLLRMKLEAFNASRSGTLLTLVSAHPYRIGQVAMYLGSLIYNLLILTIYAVMMMLISINLTLLSLLFIAAVFYVQRYISSGELRRSGTDLTVSQERLAQVATEVLNGFSLIRLCVAGPFMLARHRTAIDILRAAQMRNAYASSLITPLFITASGTLICVLLFAASVTGRGDGGTVALVLLFLFLLQRLLGPFTMITVARNAILVHMEAMFEFSDWIEHNSAQFQKDGSTPFTTMKRGIRFADVTFSYETHAGNVLRGVSFTIPKGKMAAIVGPSGAGKSTVVALLGRLFDPQNGAVLVDDVDLRDFRIESWRRCLSVVSQSIFLLNDTVERNLTFGLTRPVPDWELRQAADLAACSEFVDDLPQGYQTLLGERGFGSPAGSSSVSQWQGPSWPTPKS